MNEQYKDCNIELDILIDKVGDTQMQRDEYAYIASFLKCSNFLVFGTGYDSNYWRCVNKCGHTVFLEDDPDWIDSANDIIQVEYTSKRFQYLDFMEEYLNGNYKNLKIKLPKKVTDVEWDVIYVDAPVGNSDTAPGRMQSIFAARELATPNTDIFVHDCDRLVEDLYTSKMFDETVKNQLKLRHLRKKN